MTTLKTCAKCKIAQPHADFTNNVSTKDGKSCYCRTCAKANQSIYNGIHKVRIAKYMRDYRKTRGPLLVAKARERMYGVTNEQFECLLRSQGNKCVICKRMFGVTKGVKPHLDHSHVTKHIRGVLCNNCNTAIGLFHDDPERMRNAIIYLEKPCHELLSLAVKEASEKGSSVNWKGEDTVSGVLTSCIAVENSISAPM